MPQGERLPETWKAELGPDWAQTWQSLRHTCLVDEAHIVGKVLWTIKRV